MTDDRKMIEDSSVLLIAQSEARHTKVRQGMQAMVEACHEQLAKVQRENAQLQYECGVLKAEVERLRGQAAAGSLASLGACPFCGGADFTSPRPQFDKDEQFFVICRGCGAQGPKWHPETGASVCETPAAAAAAWNKRAEA